MNKKGIIEDIGMTVPKLVIAALSVLLLLMIIFSVINFVLFKNDDDKKVVAILKDIAEEVSLLKSELKKEPSLTYEITVPFQINTRYYLALNNNRLCAFKVEGNKLLECSELGINKFKNPNVKILGEEGVFNLKLSVEYVKVDSKDVIELSMEKS